ncbi:ribose transport system permease protein [Microbacterium sp. BE35]|uniref:ABC transporter permease n=1 Tax=Microbacterium sp. BE35 TaxID=2817773 RepID=UPI00285E8255|nr:ABC transporter permease [Microbacterium sp. BE35]MDR7188175.1 ribose transport system permease protein [Microbacterium sp. BE35]
MTTVQNPSQLEADRPDGAIGVWHATRRSRLASGARFALPALLVIFIIVFSILEPATFPTLSNFTTILSTQSVLALVALGALLTLIIGEFDLSLGAQMGLAAILLPGLTAHGVLSIPVGIIVSIAVTMLVGLANGLLVAKLKVNSFIATIGTAALIGAVMLAYSGGSAIFDGVPPELLLIASFAPLGIPGPVLYVAVISVLVWLFLKRTPLGRYMSAVGGSKDAARLSGINTERVTIITFVLAGALTGIGGVIMAGQLGSGNPAVGPSFLLPAFAAAFLGATAYTVGQFNVWGTITAVVTLATGVAGLNLMGLPNWVEPAFNGIALLTAVAVTRYLRGKPL